MHLLLTGILAASLAAAAPAADHPRLLLGKQDVPALRQKIKSEPFASMFAKLKAEADHNANGEAGKVSSDFDNQIIAHRRAFLYLLTGDDAHARESRKHVEILLGHKNWGNPRAKGLSLYTPAVYVALAYDHCHDAPSWDESFRARVSQELKRQHEVIVKSGGLEQNASPASNWQGLRGASAGLALLATDEPVEQGNQEWAHARVRRYLVENLGDKPGTRGWNIEGLGYTFYPFGNGVMAYVVAAKRHDPRLDLTQLNGISMALWTAYAGLVPAPMGLLRADFGDDNPHAIGQGCYGFAFATCPPEFLPGLKYWYDRTVGSKGLQSYDHSQFGIPASILYYPVAVQEAAPLTIPAWREAFVDTEGNGFQVYRGQYKDSTDVVGSLYAKLRGDKGHAGPDALSFRIVGLGTAWATGGGRYGPKINGQDAYWRQMNTLYPVDPDEKLTPNGNAGRVLSAVVNADGSGHSVTSISQNNVGTKNHTRRFVSSFNSGANAAFIICDTSDDGRFWQMSTLASNEITTSGNTFTITSPEGHALKGTVLHPASVTFKTGTRPRGSAAFGIKENHFIHFSSEDGDYTVVLTLAEKGKPQPTVSATGDWSGVPRGIVSVGTFRVAIDGEQIKVPGR
jgi:hypothetical protein